MNITEIRAGFKLTLAGLVRVHPVIPAKPAPPCLIVGPDDPFITYNDAMAGGLCSLHWNLVLLVQWGDDRAAQNALDELLSAGAGEDKSVIDRLHANGRNLSGVVNDVLCQQVTDYGAEVKIGDASYGQAVIKAVTHTPRI